VVHHRYHAASAANLVDDGASDLDHCSKVGGWDDVAALRKRSV
jgi:hypothetical protein